MPADDWRRRGPEFSAERLAHNLGAAERLSAAAREREVAPSVLAVAWVLSRPGVTGAIVGARSPEQVSEWGPALGYELAGTEAESLAATVMGESGPGTPLSAQP